MQGDVISMLLPLLGIILIIFLAYFSAGWVAKRYRNRVKTGRYIRILERTMLGQDKFLVVVELCGKVYFLSMTGQQVTVLDTMPQDSLPELETYDIKSDFNTLLTTVMQKQDWLKDKLKRKDPGQDQQDREKDEEKL